MARLRKEKGGGRPGAISALTSKPAHKNSKNGDMILRKQVLTLGGTQDDIDLLNSVGDNEATAGPSTYDPALSKDVSILLKELNFDVGGTKETRKNDSANAHKSGKKSKPSPQKDGGSHPRPTPQEPEKSQKIGKKKKTSHPQDNPTSTTSKPDPKREPAVDPPKVQLPTKVSLNPKSHFVCQPIALWHTTLPPSSQPTSSSMPSPSQLSILTSKAADLLHTDTQTFQTSSSSNSSASEANFLSKIIQSGTLSDRLSALTLLVQSSPIHNTKALETLKGMAERGKGKGGRDESLKALRCIVDWWVGGGAPDRKLKYFRDQPLSSPDVSDEHLLVWYFEDWLKKYFFSILQILETLSLDPLHYVRTQSMTLMFTLLRDKPEQEQNLLRLLVNKLGDTEKALCSRASYHLLQLMQTHPAMKGVIVREIISLVLRPLAPPPTSAPPASKHIRFTDADPKPKTNTAPAEKKTGNVHARYYATITFNQIVLTPEDREVSLKLIDVYFEMFKELLGEDGVEDEEEESKDPSNEDSEIVMDKGGRIRDGGKGKGKGKGKKKAKGMTEVKGAAGFTEVEDAHSKLISAILTGVNRALPFAKLDAGDIGLNKHIDTLFLITHTSTFNISLQALVLIQQISASVASSSSASSTSKSIIDRYYRTLYASLHDTRLATSSKQAMYLNLLFKSIKADAGSAGGDRVKAIVRRFVQVLVSGGGGATEFIAGGLYLLGELFSTLPGLRKMINQEDTMYTDNSYDPRKRDPQFAHASSSPLWELTPLLHHYHPAVSLHARQLLLSQPLTASADLSQNTLSHFLDRFVYKNPKKIKPNENFIGTGKSKGASAMQPAASGLDGTGVKLMKGEIDDQGLMNEDGFLQKKAEDIPVDQLFFHKFFSRKSEKEKAKHSKVDKRRGDGTDEEDEELESAEKGAENIDEAHSQQDDEDDEDDSEEDEAEVWKAMKATMPKAIGDDDDDLLEDSDDLPSDFEDEMNGGDSGVESEEVDSDDALSLAEGSYNDDLISLDGDSPDGLIEFDGSDSDEEAWGGIGEDAGGKKRKREDSSREKRKKLKSLPTFASYDDYAKMIEDSPEDDI